MTIVVHEVPATVSRLLDALSARPKEGGTDGHFRRAARSGPTMASARKGAVLVGLCSLTRGPTWTLAHRYHRQHAPPVSEPSVTTCPAKLALHCPAE
jgi:hypothetical protein